jgi:hypothetical protein
MTMVQEETDDDLKEAMAISLTSFEVPSTSSLLAQGEGHLKNADSSNSEGLMKEDRDVIFSEEHS